MGTNHVVSQRVVPIKSLKQGYRHLRLKNATNQNLPLSTLFIYSSFQEEGMEIGASINFSNGHEGKSSTSMELSKKLSTYSSEFSRLEKESTSGLVGSAPIRRRMFFLVVHGVVSDETSTILKITQESTTKEVVAQALGKAGKSSESACDYVLIEEVAKGWDKKSPFMDRGATTQRILDPDERPLESQANWKGEGRFMVKKIADDPSSRAWFNTIKAQSQQKERLKRRDSDEFSTSWGEEMENFLVCVYNVSEDQPYAILKASMAGTAQDIISQALLKARRMENPKNFVLIEEIEIENDSACGSGNQRGKHRESTTTVTRRILDANENVYSCQAAWKTKGLFRLVKINEIDNIPNRKSEPGKSSPNFGLNAKNFCRISRGSKGSLMQYKYFSSKSKDCRQISSTLTCVNIDPNASSSGITASPRNSPRKYGFRFGNAESRSLPETNKLATSTNNSLTDRNSLRHIRSEGETIDEYTFGDFDDANFKSSLSFAKLKRLSLRKLRAWKSGKKDRFQEEKYG